MLDKLQSFTVERDTEPEPRVVAIDSESASSTIEAISAETTRQIIASLHEEPRPPSKIASEVDTSLANVNYHLEKLQDAGLITAVDTWYSEKGKEMKVYAPTEDPLVFAGSAENTGRVRSLLKQVGTAMAFLVAASVFVQWFVTDLLVSTQQTAPLRKATSAGTIDGIDLTPIPPGLLFFTGGTFVLTITVLVWFFSTRGR